jgi:hypothetical protein
MALLTVCCDSRLLESLCLVCRVRCTYSLPPTLGVVCLSLIPTAAGASDVRDVSIEEEVVEADLLGSQLHQQRALPLAKLLVELQHPLGGHRRVSVCRAAFLVFPPCADPRPLCLFLAPSLERCPERV